MTPDEKRAISDIQGSPGWKVLEYILAKKIDELKDVTNLNPNLTIPMDVQAISRQEAVKLLKEFLSGLGFTQTIKKDNTYE